MTVLEADAPAAGASGAAAGLVNPFMARKANPAWRYAEALDALHALLDAAGAAALFRRQGVLRPAASPKQAEFFQTTATAFPYDAAWWSPGAVAERWPEVHGPHGALWIPRGGSVELPRMVDALLRAARQRGALVRTGAPVTAWGETESRAFVETASGERIEGAQVLLALGGGFVGHAPLEELGLHRVKGQTVRVRRPGALAPARLAALPALSGGGYVVPAPEDDHLILGSSFEHNFADLRPSPEVTRRIVARAARSLPVLEGAAVMDETAGVRVTREDARMPLCGPLPGSRRVWAFTALGAKGLLSAPLLARALPGYLRAPDTIPSPVRPS